MQKQTFFLKATLLTGLLVFAFLLAACGQSQTTSTTTTAPKDNSTVAQSTVASTSSKATPAGNNAAVSVVFKNYNAKFFSVSYPETWKNLNMNDQNSVKLDSNNGLEFTVGTNTPGLGKTLDPAGFLANGCANLTNCKQVTNMATTTINGTPWLESTVTYTSKTGVPMKQVMLAGPKKVPAGHIFVITYNAPTTSFDAAYKMYFQPMLDTFKYSA